MTRAFDKMQKTRRRQSSLRTTCLAAGVTIYAAGGGSAFADDSFDPLKGLKNLFSGEKYETKIVPDVPAEELYNQALAKLQDKDFGAAAKKFEEVEKQYPYSQWQRKAILMLTFSHYQNGSYDDAIASAKRY